jgi:hypothetical protein
MPKNSTVNRPNFKSEVEESRLVSHAGGESLLTADAEEGSPRGKSSVSERLDRQAAQGGGSETVKACIAHHRLPKRFYRLRLPRNIRFTQASGGFKTKAMIKIKAIRPAPIATRSQNIASHRGC